MLLLFGINDGRLANLIFQAVSLGKALRCALE